MDILLPEPAGERFELEFALSRQQVLTYLVKLNRANESMVWDLANTLLQKFCQSLTQYLAIGHQRTFARSAPAAHQYVAIAATSRAVMRFIDRYGREPNQPLPELDLSEPLEQLALALATRFQLEDELRLGISD